MQVLQCRLKSKYHVSEVSSKCFCYRYVNFSVDPSLNKCIPVLNLMKSLFAIGQQQPALALPPWIIHECNCTIEIGTMQISIYNLSGFISYGVSTTISIPFYNPFAWNHSGTFRTISYLPFSRTFRPFPPYIYLLFHSTLLRHCIASSILGLSTSSFFLAIDVPIWLHCFPFRLSCYWFFASNPVVIYRCTSFSTVHSSTTVSECCSDPLYVEIFSYRH